MKQENDTKTEKYLSQVFTPYYFEYLDDEGYHIHPETVNKDGKVPLGLSFCLVQPDLDGKKV